jgi:hypothetical protein
VDTLPDPVQAAVDAANRGDVEAFLGAFDEAGVVDDWGREFAGRNAIRRWSDAEFIGKQVTLAVTGVEHDEPASWSVPRSAATASMAPATSASTSTAPRSGA